MFHSFLFAADLGKVRTALENGTDVNSRGPEGCTGLMIALRNKHNSVARLFLDHPALDLTIRCPEYDRTALHWAAVHNNREGVLMLYSHPAVKLKSFNDKDGHGKSPLTLAVSHKCNSVAQQLLRIPGIDVNLCDNLGRTALQHAVFDDNLMVAGMLLAHPHLSSVNRKWGGVTPLAFAVKYNKAKCVPLLLADPHVDLDTRDNYKRTPQEIERFVQRQQSPISKVLLDGLYDEDCLFSLLRGCQHIMRRILEELIKYWEKRALLGRTLEERARAPCSKGMDYCPGPRRDGHPQLERLVIEARQKRAGKLPPHLGFSSRNSHQAVPLILVHNFGGKIIAE